MSIENKFTVIKFHKYGERDKIFHEARLSGSFPDVREKLIDLLKPDKTREESDWFIATNDKRIFKLQSRGHIGPTKNAHIAVVLIKEYSGGGARLKISPNHHTWESSRPQLESLTRTIRMELDYKEK